MHTQPRHPLAQALTFADLRRGDWFSIGDLNPTCRVRYADPHGSWGVRVEWDHGPGTRAHVRIFPRDNDTEVLR